jgi:hypothetical protein
MRRSIVVWLAAAIVGMGLVGSPAAAGPKPKPQILHTVDVGPGTFAENTISAFQINVTRSGPLRCASSVAYAIDNVTTSSGDYSATTAGTLTFAKNEATKSVSVTMVNDTLWESAETFTFTLSNATTSCKGGILATVGSAQTVTITDGDEGRFIVPATYGFQVSGTLTGCNAMYARLTVPGDFVDMAFKTGCGSTSVNYTWNNTTGSPAEVLVGIVDTTCGYNHFFSDHTTWDQTNGYLVNADHAVVAAKATNIWDVDINDGGSGTCLSNNIPTTNAGNLTVDVSIWPPGG